MRLLMARLEGTEDRGRFTAASGAPGGLGAAAASSAGGARGGRRVPAARSLAPTLLNGFLWLDVYLSFVFAFVSQLLHRRLTATFLSFFAAQRAAGAGGRPRARPPRAKRLPRRTPRSGAHWLGPWAGAEGTAGNRAAAVFCVRPQMRSIVRMTQELGSRPTPSPGDQPLLLEPLCPGLGGSSARPHQPLGDT